jgi:hypothetical protein
VAPNKGMKLTKPRILEEAGTFGTGESGDADLDTSCIQLTDPSHHFEQCTLTIITRVTRWAGV